MTMKAAHRHRRATAIATVIATVIATAIATMGNDGGGAGMAAAMAAAMEGARGGVDGRGRRGEEEKTVALCGAGNLASTRVRRGA